MGLLKEELRRCGSLIMACADAHRVEAGGVSFLAAVFFAVVFFAAVAFFVVVFFAAAFLGFSSASAAGPTGDSGGAAGDEAAKDVPGAPHGIFRGAGVFQLSAVHVHAVKGDQRGRRVEEIQVFAVREQLRYLLRQLLRGQRARGDVKDPKTGREPFAVVQLRKDNAQGSIYNMVARVRGQLI